MTQSRFIHAKYVFDEKFDHEEHLKNDKILSPYPHLSSSSIVNLLTALRQTEVSGKLIRCTKRLNQIKIQNHKKTEERNEEGIKILPKWIYFEVPNRGSHARHFASYGTSKPRNNDVSHTSFPTYGRHLFSLTHH